MWLHVQFVINTEIIVWIYRCYIMITDIELRNDGLTPCYCWWCAGLGCTESGWVSGYVTCHLVTLTKEYSGSGSLTFCSSISKFGCWRVGM